MIEFSPYAAAVLIALSIATIGLMYYVRIVMPKQIEQRFTDSLQGFSTAIELRFPSHEGLTARVVPLSVALGKAAGLSHVRIRDLTTAAQLRDIGLCAIPYRLLNEKPTSEWTEADHATYWRHPEVAAAMLEMIPSLRHVAHIVRSHHASYDGREGPFSPSGDAIPVEARILCITSEYVWLERTMGHLLASEKLRELSGGRFDPELVDLFLAVLTSPREPERRESVAQLV